MTFTLCSLVIHFNGIVALPVVFRVCVFSFCFLRLTGSPALHCIRRCLPRFPLQPLKSTCTLQVVCEGGGSCRVIYSGWTEREGAWVNWWALGIRARFVCACAVQCVFICSGREDEGGGVWSAGQGGRGDSQLRGFWLQPWKYTRLIKHHCTQIGTPRVPTDPPSFLSLFTLTLPTLFPRYLNISKRWMPTSPWGRGEGGGGQRYVSFGLYFPSWRSATVLSQHLAPVCMRPVGPL